MLVKMKTEFHRHVSSPELICRFCAILITNQTDLRNKQERNLKTQHNSERDREKQTHRHRELPGATSGQKGGGRAARAQIGGAHKPSGSTEQHGERRRCSMITVSGV